VFLDSCVEESFHFHLGFLKFSIFMSMLVHFRLKYGFWIVMLMKVDESFHFNFFWEIKFSFLLMYEMYKIFHDVIDCHITKLKFILIIKCVSVKCCHAVFEYIEIIKKKSLKCPLFVMLWIKLTNRTHILRSSWTTKNMFVDQTKFWYIQSYCELWWWLTNLMIKILFYVYKNYVTPLCIRVLGKL
jgi:hypothetical protein